MTRFFFGCPASSGHWRRSVQSRPMFAQSVTEKKSTPEAASTYWIFLTAGKSSQGTERSEIEKMQAAHLANFGRLYKAGKLLTAGPLADPQKKMARHRGRQGARLEVAV